MIPRAATGQRDDPNSTAWAVVGLLGLRRAILYTCVASFGLTHLRGVEATASLRLQVVHSGPVETFNGVAGECPHPELNPDVPEGVVPALEVQKPADPAEDSNSQWTGVVQRPSPARSPVGDGCCWRIGGPTAASARSHLTRRSKDASPNRTPLLPPAATEGDLRRSTCPSGLPITVTVTALAVRQTACELCAPLVSILPLLCPNCRYNSPGPITLCCGFFEGGPC